LQKILPVRINNPGSAGCNIMHARALAAVVLTEVLTQRLSLTRVLPEHLERLSHEQDRAFAQELCYGVMRWYFRLEVMLAPMLKKVLKQKHLDIKMLMMIGLYQFDYMHVPEHATVSATVAACDELDKPWAKKLVNAILRRYQREHSAFTESLEQNIDVLHAHPEWLVRNLQHDYPSLWMQIIEANNQRPPMFLRINQRQTTREDYLEKLERESIPAKATTYSPVGIKLGKPVAVEYLPGFKDGIVSVQDLAAQLAVPMLETGSGQRILDACAAPGGKLAHILEYANDLCDVSAIELVPERANKIIQTLDRLRLQARIIVADARTPESWWDGRQYDRILLDAPCSATGVIRRHPDIKVLRSVGDVESATRTQSDLLAALWPLLKPGGKLLYSTCSVLTCENDNQISGFIAAHHDAAQDTIRAEWGLHTACGEQIVTGHEDMDGFYYARLQKI
jgi:16S rRNA (cytosine967-C5)-methyltransferase